jgi:hypothetical protein
MRKRKGPAKKDSSGRPAREPRPRYRQIQVRMHSDRKFMALSDPPPCGKYLWYYLLSGPHTGIIPGVSVAGEAQLAEALKWSLEGFRESFRECAEKDIVMADWKARVLFVPNALRHNPPQNPNVVKSWRDAWEEVPECELKSLIFLRIRSFLSTLGEEYARAFESLGKSFPESFAKSFPESGTGTGTGTGGIEVIPPVALLRGRAGGRKSPPDEADPGSPDDGQAAHLFTVYAEEHALCRRLRGETPNEPRLTPPRRGLLGELLQIYPAEEIEAAIRGAKFSDWHMGEVDGQPKLGIEQILATKGPKNHLEALAGLFRNPPRWARERWRGDPEVFPEPVPGDHAERIDRVLSVAPMVNGFRPQIEALKGERNQTLVVRNLEAITRELRAEAIAAGVDASDLEAEGHSRPTAYVLAVRRTESSVPSLAELYRDPEALALWEDVQREGRAPGELLSERVHAQVFESPG